MKFSEWIKIKEIAMPGATGSAAANPLNKMVANAVNDPKLTVDKLRKLAQTSAAAKRKEAAAAAQSGRTADAINAAFQAGDIESNMAKMIQGRK